MVYTNLRLSGLATGMDTESIIQSLMKIHRQPVEKKIKDKQIWQWKQEDYRAINTSLLSLRNKVFNMRLESVYLAKKAVTGDENIVTASANASAPNGVYNIKVTQLATAASNTSTSAVSANPSDKIDTSASLLSQAGKFATPGTFFNGMFAQNTFNVTVNYAETESKTFTFTYGDSLDSVINTINNDKDVGISMFYDSGTDKIVLSSKATGAAAKLEITGDLFNTVLKIDNGSKVAGQDAVFELNGLVTSRSSNSFSINGVSFNLKGLTPGGLAGTATSVLVDTDTDTIYNNIKDFIDAYNEVLETLDNKVREERFRDYLPLTDEEKEAMRDSDIEKWEQKARSGLLRNDSIIYGTISAMRNIMASVVEGVSGSKNLAELGITTGSYWEHENGKLKIDEGKLRKAIQEDPRGVYELFANDSSVDGEKGLARRLHDTLDNSIKRIIAQAGTGTALRDNSYISRTIESLDKQIDSMEKRLETVENRYWRQYTAMEKAISAMNQQGNWLTQQLNGLFGKS